MDFSSTPSCFGTRGTRRAQPSFDRIGAKSRTIGATFARPAVPLLLRTMASTAAVPLVHVDVALVYRWTPPRQYAVSPGAAAVCARAHDAKGAASMVPATAGASLPFGAK